MRSARSFRISSGASTRSKPSNTHVFTDPRTSGNTGDSHHGNAQIVIGSLQTICAINGFGLASFKTGSWVQL